MTIKELAEKAKAAGVLSIEIELGTTQHVTAYGQAKGAPEYATKSKMTRGASTSLELAVERAIEAFATTDGIKY